MKYFPSIAFDEMSGSAKGVTALVSPPSLLGVDAPAAAEVAISASAMTFTLSAIPASVANLKLIIEATAGMSKGITRAYSKFA